MPQYRRRREFTEEEAAARTARAVEEMEDVEQRLGMAIDYENLGKQIEKRKELIAQLDAQLKEVDQRKRNEWASAEEEIATRKAIADDQLRKQRQAVNDHSTEVEAQLNRRIHAIETQEACLESSAMELKQRESEVQRKEMDLSIRSQKLDTRQYEVMSREEKLGRDLVEFRRAKDTLDALAKKLAARDLEHATIKEGLGREESALNFRLQVFEKRNQDLDAQAKKVSEDRREADKYISDLQKMSSDLAARQQALEVRETAADERSVALDRKHRQLEDFKNECDGQYGQLINLHGKVQYEREQLEKSRAEVTKMWAKVHSAEAERIDGR